MEHCSGTEESHLAPGVILISKRPIQLVLFHPLFPHYLANYFPFRSLPNELLKDMVDFVSTLQFQIIFAFHSKIALPEIFCQNINLGLLPQMPCTGTAPLINSI